MGMSQEQLALAADIDRRYMSDVENGKRNISLDIIERLANCVGISVSDLMRQAEGDTSSFQSVDELKQWLCDNGYEESVVLENPDFLSAVVGVDVDGRVIYDYELMAEHLVVTDEMDYEEAVEFIDYNTIGALPYMGEKAPIIMYHVNI